MSIKHEIFTVIKNKFDNRFKELLINEKENLKYHLEGDTYSHTLMTVKEAFLDNYDNENIKECVIYVLSAFLHDIGKPLAKKTNKDNYHTGHSGLGIFLSINFIKDVFKDLNKLDDTLNLNVKDLITILYIINYHDAHWIYKNKFKNYFEYDEEIVKLLKTFNKYDVLGRISLPDFRIIKYPEINFKDKITYIAERRVNILIGVPNSGKDTYLKNQNINKEFIISRDDILIEYAKKKGIYEEDYNNVFRNLTPEDHKNIDSILDKAFTSYLKDKNKSEIYINLTNTSFKSRRRWLSKIKEYHNVEVNFIVFLEDYTTIMERNKLRKNKTLNENIIISFMKKFCLPVKSETEFLHNIIFTI